MVQLQTASSYFVDADIKWIMGVVQTSVVTTDVEAALTQRSLF